MKYNFVAMILTHGRPEKVYTYKSLRTSGYTGPIVLVVDNEDKTVERYKELYGDGIYVFDKLKEVETTDACDNFQHRKAIVYARNASFRIAKELGYEYFMQLDDDYQSWQYRKGRYNQYQNASISNLDSIFESLLDFYIASHADAIAIAQGGDFIGGSQNYICYPNWKVKRKTMNTWFCHVDNLLNFAGHMNEDCSQYTVEGRRGKLFMQIPFVSIKQPPTQGNSGGMSELYQDSGTYLKTFYTVMQAPSCTKINLIYSTHRRIHHNIYFNNCASKIISEKWKKL